MVLLTPQLYWLLLKGIVAAKIPVLLVEPGGHIEISKGWVKSLFC